MRKKEEETTGQQFFFAPEGVREKNLNAEQGGVKEKRKKEKEERTSLPPQKAGDVSGMGNNSQPGVGGLIWGGGGILFFS